MIRGKKISGIWIWFFNLIPKFNSQIWFPNQIWMAGPYAAIIVLWLAVTTTWLQTDDYKPWLTTRWNISDCIGFQWKSFTISPTECSLHERHPLSEDCTFGNVESHRAIEHRAIEQPTEEQVCLENAALDQHTMAIESEIHCHCRLFLTGDAFGRMQVQLTFCFLSLSNSESFNR